MLKSKHFKTEQALLDWVNSPESPKGIMVAGSTIIVKDTTNGDWIIFYIEEK